MEENYIGFTEPAAFKGLDSLTYLMLYENQLSSLQEGIFTGLPSLYGLYLMRNNMKTIGKRAFAGIGNKLSRLDLQHNELSTFPSDSFADDFLPSYLRIWLSDNNILCNESVCWLAQGQDEGTREVYGTCSGPGNLTGVDLADLNEQSICKLDTTSSIGSTLGYSTDMWTESAQTSEGTSEIPIYQSTPGNGTMSGSNFFLLIT